jgi:hypothetical protein
MALRNQGTHHSLDGEIDLGDEIDSPLLTDLKCAAESLQLNRTGLPDGVDGGL